MPDDDEWRWAWLVRTLISMFVAFALGFSCSATRAPSKPRVIVHVNDDYTFVCDWLPEREDYDCELRGERA